MHNCPDCGLAHDAAESDAPVVVEADVTAPADVEIARIEADRDVTVARIAAGVDKATVESRLDALESENRTLREIVDRLAPRPAPEPEPEPVVVEAPPAPEPEPELPPAPERETPAEPKPKRVKRGFF